MRPLFSLRAILVVLVLAPTAALLAQITRIDHAKANINGKKGLSVWPELPDRTPGDPTGYEAVLARREQPEIWLRFPAGKWVAPPAGEYLMLIEGDLEVSPYPILLHWSNGPFEGKGSAHGLLHVAAGKVHVEGACPSKHCLAWLLHESSHLEAMPGYFQREMLRIAPLEIAQHDGVLMPAGRIAAAVYDAMRKEFVAIQLPFNVQPMQSPAIRPASPKAGRSGLILELSRPSMIPKRAQDDVGISMVADQVKVAPAFTVRTHSKIIAIWNDLPSGSAKIEVSSPTLRLAQADVHTHSGKIEYVSRNLVALPKLSVKWQIPSVFGADQPTIKIADVSGNSPPIVMSPEKNANTIETTVPAAPLSVTLKVGSWSVSKNVDTSDGVDRSLLLEMVPIRITGHVYYGDHPTPATITFRTDAEWKQSLTVEADDSGKYDALFAKPYAYTALVTLNGRSAPYALPGFTVEVDGTKDIHIPANSYRFRITRSDNGRPIEGAKIVIGNRVQTEEQLVLVQTIATDGRGEATAQPLRPGLLHVSADAKGFVHYEKPEEAVIDSGEHVYEIALDPLGQTDSLTLRLPNGQPASGASVMIRGTRERRVEIADADGRVDVPRADAGGLVLVKAAGAAVTARTWRGEDETWTLDAAGDPLVVHAVRSDGSSAPFAPGVLWLDGVRLADDALGWLASSSGSDGAGYWLLRNLPARPVQLLLWLNTQSNYALAPQQAFDAMRTTIQSPRPTTIDVRVIE